MKSRMLVPLLVILGLILYYLLFNPKPESASLILFNGVIHTVNEKQPTAEAVAIRDGRIVAVGSDSVVKASFISAHSVDLQGRTVVPGFIDSHAHVEGLGAALRSLDLSTTTSLDEVLGLIRERAQGGQPGVWIRGRGWDQNKWASKRFPTRHMLDSVARDVPVYLRRVDGHAVWVNSKALDLAGIGRETLEPEGGRIVRDGSGMPTGVFIDNAIALLDSVLPSPSIEERTATVEAAVAECVKMGLSEVHDMGVDLEGIRIYEKLIENGRLPLRIYAAIDGPGPTWEHYIRQGPDIGGHQGKLTVRALKMYADGALGSRGAALIEPYSDDPENRGLTLTSSAELREVTTEAIRRGFQVCVHAIGDRANHLVLDAYQEAINGDEKKGSAARLRVEHAQVLDPADVPRFHQLGVVPAMQPSHCTSDMTWAEERLGPRRVLGAYAWRSLIDAGSVIPGGSDFPVESPNPLWGFYAAITRQDFQGLPGGGWYPQQRMTREEAIRSFSLWGAYAAFEESTKGSIEPGKVADLVVLSHDIMSIHPRDILSTRVEATLVGGHVVYSSQAFSPVLASSGIEQYRQ